MIALAKNEKHFIRDDAREYKVLLSCEATGTVGGEESNVAVVFPDKTAIIS